MRVKLGLVSALLMTGCASTQDKWPVDFYLYQGDKLSQIAGYADFFSSLNVDMPKNHRIYIHKTNDSDFVFADVTYFKEEQISYAVQQAKVYTSWISDFQKSSEHDGITVMNVRPDSELTCSGKFESREKLNQCYYNIYPIVEMRQEKSGAECALSNAPLYDDKEDVYGFVYLRACSLSMSASDLAKKILPTIQESQRSNYLSKVFKKP
ncbi:hypothetical protein AAEX90_001796 [Vibrio cholerae]